MVDRYTRGSDIFRLLASADGAVRAQAAECKVALERIEKTAQDDLRRRGEQLVELAQHYLPAVSSETVSNTFREVRRDLQRILERKQLEEQELQKEWDKALDRRQQLQDDLDIVTRELDELVEQREELEEKLADRLEQDEAFQDLSRRALRSEQELARNRDRVEDSKQEAAEKLPAYKKSSLFQYLIDRGYGTSKYKKRGLTRRLDRWVARLVNFEKAKKSYDFLQVTPELMAAEVERRRDEFERLMEEVEGIEQRHSTEIGLTDVLKEGLKVGKRRDTLLTRIESEHQSQIEVEKDLDKLAGEDNEYYRQAIERMRKFLEGLKESALEAKTRGTASTTDDAIFAEIKWLNDRLEDARQQAKELRRQQSGMQRNRNDLQDLGRRFRTAEFDSQRSVFPAGFDPRPDIERLVRGEVSKEALWDEIKRHQRFLPTWVERRYENSGGLLDGEFSYLLMRVLAEAAGAAIRHAADSHSRSRRASSRSSGVRRRARGGFTGGIGF